MSNIGWIGVGNMGSRMSRRLMDAGHALYVCDIVSDNTADLVRDGAVYAQYPEDLCGTCEFIFSMIPDAAALKDITAGEHGIINKAGDGLIFVDMSTVDPDSSAEVRQMVEETGAKFLGSTVTGSISYAEEGTLGIMCSGEREVFDRTLPLLEILGNRQRYLGEQEQARYMKICINMMLGTVTQALAESLVLGEKVGIAWDELVECMCDSAAAANIMKAKEDAIKSRDFTPMCTSDTLEKDMNIAMDQVEKYGLELPLASTSRRYYADMRKNDMGMLDYSGLILLNEKICGIDNNEDA